MSANPRTRPQYEYAWYGITQEEWDAATDRRQRELTHVGRIEETTDGELAPHPCRRCIDKGYTCRRYTAAALAGIANPISRCARCLYSKATQCDAHKLASMDKQNGLKRRLDQVSLIRRDRESADLEDDEDYVERRSLRYKRVDTTMTMVDEPATPSSIYVEQPNTATSQVTLQVICKHREEVQRCLADEHAYTVGTKSWATHQKLVMDRLDVLEGQSRLSIALNQSLAVMVQDLQAEIERQKLAQRESNRLF